MAVQGISWFGVVVRVVLAVLLVLVTFNPRRHVGLSLAEHAACGHHRVEGLPRGGLLIAWVVCLRTAYVALGALGLVLGCLLVGTFVWLLFDGHLLPSSGREMPVWIGLIVFGVVLGFGLSWSLIRARTTGQIEVQ